MLFSNDMATLTTLWFMSMMLTGWCFSNKGPLVTPSPPDCYIPCDDSGCSSHIKCTWNPMPGSNNNLTYTLHWDGGHSNGTGHSAIIQRHLFESHSDLQVWVEATSQDGTVSKSEPVTFYTVDIYKPSPPKITSSFVSENSLEIHWMPHCNILGGLGHCEVRHCTEAQAAWILDKDGYLFGSFSLYNPEPYTNYLFQVQCACSTGLMSEWSEVHTMRSPERAPIGKLDVWKDCGIFPHSTKCVLTWKKLPMSKVRGQILGYNLKLLFNNGTILTSNESVGASLRLVCSQVQCYYNSSLKNVTSISIDTYNAVGVTPLSHLDLPGPAKHKEGDVYLEMNENSLNVSWKEKSSRIKEFVVQYKEAGSSLGQGMDWIRLNASLTKVTMKGQFKKFAAYQVSVFSVLDDNKIQLCCTDVTHFVQGLPPEVPSFKENFYGTTHVTLLWETVLMSVQNGVTPYYQIGYDNNNVRNISAYPQLEQRNITLENLKEDHNYKIWIKAVNQAGAGPNRTVTFRTLSRANNGTITKILLSVFGVAVLLLLLISAFCFSSCKACPAVLSFLSEKVPDPHNSKIIREMKSQINDSLNWLRVPAKEQCPIISEIEIVKTSSSAFIPQTDKIDADHSLEDIVTEDHKKTHCRCGKQEYSKMIDSDEEKSEEDETFKNSWSSEEEDNAGYEQHFMPTNLDILEMAAQETTEQICEE